MASDQHTGTGDDPDYIASRILASLASSPLTASRGNSSTSATLPRHHATSRATLHPLSESPELTSTSLPSRSGATTTSISPAPPSGIVGLLYLPAEVLSEVAEYLKHPWDRKEWYEPFFDFPCCRSEFVDRHLRDETAAWTERRRSRADILSFASVNKSMRRMVMMNLFKRIGFNLCANQHDRPIPELAVESCRELFINKDSRDHRIQDDHPLSYTDFMPPFVNARQVTISFRLFADENYDYDRALQQGLIHAANAGDDRRERRRRGEDAPFTNSNVERLIVKAMAAGEHDWFEQNGLWQLDTLQLIFRQLDLPNIRCLKFRQENMWGFHQSMRSHWENMTEALQVADYPALEELELELEMDMDAIACDAVLCDVIQDLLSAIHPSRILRRFSVSMTFNVTFYQEEGCPWREEEEDAGLAQPFLRPEVFPDLARLLLLVKTLQDAHPHVNSFHMDLGATFVVNMGEPAPARRKQTYAFWVFDYLLNPDPRQRIGDFAPPDTTRGGFTSRVRVDRDEFARYTVYEDKIRESFRHAFVGGGSSSDEQSGGEQTASGSEEQLTDGREEHLATGSDSTLTSLGDESEATGSIDQQHAG